MLLEIDPVEEAYAYAVKDKRTMRLNMLAVVLNETIGHDITRKQW